ncbi:hypothetical protein PIB30_078283 [Stylosanthes scabra]|uniref:Uncharacterized protein n=1 Tax=Stylosanthes scabra TaxID=79078 RepID=A0ABU6ZPF4_9FABA|nr:hypothetical protein [Stylosanthes scabra]
MSSYTIQDSGSCPESLDQVRTHSSNLAETESSLQGGAYAPLSYSKKCVRTEWTEAHFMASKGKSVSRQPSTRTRGASSRRQPSQEAARYETPIQAERGELVIERKVLHERVINFRGKRDTFREHIARRGWDFMYDPTIDINMTLVREFYANRNEKNQKEVYMRGKRIPCHFRDIEGILHLPRLEGKSEHHQAGERYDRDDLDMNEVM